MDLTTQGTLGYNDYTQTKEIYILRIIKDKAILSTGSGFYFKVTQDSLQMEIKYQQVHMGQYYQLQMVFTLSPHYQANEYDSKIEIT